MSQPFHIYGSTDGGRSLARRPIVLARIPHVGTQVSTEAESAPVDHAAPAPAVESQPAPFPQGTRFYVDSQHSSAPHAEPQTHQQAETQSRTPGHRRSHRAHGQPRSPESLTAGSPQPSLATGLSRLHEELASYAGLIVTLALLASGALLYWMIVAPSRAPVADYSNSYETFGSAEIDIPKFAPPTTLPVDRQFASPSELSALPGTTAESTSELLRLPEQTPVPSDEPEPIFNDASAKAYPATNHPHGWDLARLRVTDVAGENVAASSSKPEMPRPAMPPMPTPIDR